MDVIIVLIPISIVLVLLALRALAWSVDSGQFDDLDREAQRILFEETPTAERAADEGSDDDGQTPR
ncbi:MAG: cbb3-type cytochrome oxidase assembly protein CcoS [Pseudomonadales bacterium]|jgi:cbb3-type cytochrome oxidase maturation protein|nr:cbb3-type cytochrome oxidase assembly protein CcoS [Pseudomonadales bacterium]